MRQLCPALTALALASTLAACSGDDGTPADPDAAISVDANVDAAIDAAELPHFSFFATSLRALRELSGSQDGFGGDLRFGETGPNAGIRGADKICAAIAERSMPGSSSKQWRAFLSAANDGTGQPIHAINRIGNGPWYDRLGRLLAPDLDSMRGDRPAGGDAAIRNDFPNEDGVPNHNPDGTGQVDNHDFLTGTTRQGTLEAANRTCLDWTGKTGNTQLEGSPRVGHSWPRQGSGVNWMYALVETGCAPGINLIETGGPRPPDPNNFARNTVGSGGGYGGFYCFALVP